MVEGQQKQALDTVDLRVPLMALQLKERQKLPLDSIWEIQSPNDVAVIASSLVDDYVDVVLNNCAKRLVDTSGLVGKELLVKGALP